MRESGSLTRDTAQDSRGLVTETPMKVNTRKARCMGRASMYGIRENTTRDSGRMDLRTVTEFGVANKGTRT